MSEIERGVKHSISNIQRSVRAYVFDGENSAYRVVAVELRKLLLDTNAAASFATKGRKRKKNRSLYELRFGSGKYIYLRSFMPDPEDQQGSREYMAVSSNVYTNRIDILRKATHGGRMVSLPVWLDEPFVHSNDGTVMKVRTVLQDIANKEGAHVIRLEGRDRRTNARIAFTSGPVTTKDVTTLDFLEHWEQFVIDAGMRLLDARRLADGDPLIEHGINVPERQVRTTRIEKIRPDMEQPSRRAGRKGYS